MAGDKVPVCPRVMSSKTSLLPCVPRPTRSKQGWVFALHESVFSPLKALSYRGCELWKKPAVRKVNIEQRQLAPTNNKSNFAVEALFSFSFSVVTVLVTEEVGPLTWSGISPNHVYTTLCIRSGKQNDDWLSNSG